MNHKDILAEHQIALDALSQLMFSKPKESEKDMEVLDAVDIMEGNDVYDMDDSENRRTSWPQPSLKKRTSIRLRSLQNNPNFPNQRQKLRQVAQYYARMI